VLERGAPSLFPRLQAIEALLRLLAPQDARVLHGFTRAGETAPDVAGEALGKMRQTRLDAIGGRPQPRFLDVGGRGHPQTGGKPDGPKRRDEPLPRIPVIPADAVANSGRPTLWASELTKNVVW